MTQRQSQDVSQLLDALKQARTDNVELRRNFESVRMRTRPHNSQIAPMQSQLCARLTMRSSRACTSP